MKDARVLYKEEDENEEKILNESDKQLMAYLVKMGRLLGGDKIDLSQVGSTLEGLELLKKSQEREYYNALLHPEKTRGVKLPSTIPIPSSSFQLKQSVNVTVNSSGNACIVINPFYLAPIGMTATSSMYINNDVSLDGSSTSNFFTSVNLGQGIPAVYNQYRLVSASVCVKYVGRLDAVRGLVGGAIIFDQNVPGSNVGTVNAALAKYGDFNLAQDAFFQQEYFALHGMRQIYFPLDNNFEVYNNLGTSKDGFAFLLYFLRTPPSETSFKLDVYFNMECLPDVTFLNYIPTSLSCNYGEDKQLAVRSAQARPIMSESDYSSGVQKYKKGTGSTKGFVDMLAQKVGAYLPSLQKVADFVSKAAPVVKSIGTLI